MTRFLAFFALVLALPGMSKTPDPEPMPMACEVLESVDIAASYAPGTTLDLNVMSDDDAARLSLCTVITVSDEPGLSLLLRDVPGDAATGAEQTRTTYTDGLVGEMGLEPEAMQEVAIGEAGLWIEEIGQLTVWIRGGSVMMIFSIRPASARAFAEEIAAKVVSTYP